MGNYWNDNYWRRHLAEPERMDIFEELWIGKHQELINKLNKGHALDLGCGIGQFTDYWINNGFQVTSADISVNALNALKERTPTATTVELDMSKPLPFEDALLMWYSPIYQSTILTRKPPSLCLGKFTGF